MFLAHEQDVLKDISFSQDVQILEVKINLHLNIPVYSLTSLSNIKDEPHTHISNKKGQQLTF